MTAQYPIIKKLNNDTTVTYNVSYVKTIAKICSDRAYLIIVNDSLKSMIYKDSLIEDTYISVIKDKNFQLQKKDDIINNDNAEFKIYNDIIEEDEAIIKTKTIWSYIYKGIITILTIALILK